MSWKCFKTSVCGPCLHLSVNITRIEMKCFQIAFPVALVESLTNVVAYIGETATLPSGADRSWKLSQIDWSIYRNITNIASYQRGVETVDLFDQFRGRLSLSLSSGRRPIRHLRTASGCEHNWQWQCLCNLFLFTRWLDDSRCKAKRCHGVQCWPHQ